MMISAMMIRAVDRPGDPVPSQRDEHRLRPAGRHQVGRGEGEQQHRDRGRLLEEGQAEQYPQRGEDRVHYPAAADVPDVLVHRHGQRELDGNRLDAHRPPGQVGHRHRREQEQAEREQQQHAVAAQRAQRPQQREPGQRLQDHERARPQAPVVAAGVHRPEGQREHPGHEVAEVVLEQQVQGERLGGEAADGEVVLLEEAAVQHEAVEADLGRDERERAEGDALAHEPGGEAGPAGRRGRDGPVFGLGHLCLPPGRRIRHRSLDYRPVTTK